MADDDAPAQQSQPAEPPPQPDAPPQVPQSPEMPKPDMRLLDHITAGENPPARLPAPDLRLIDGEFKGSTDEPFRGVERE